MIQKHRQETEQAAMIAAGIEIVSEEKTIASELFTRNNTRRRINRSIYDEPIYKLPVNELEEMQVENDHYIKKLLDLKRDLSPFKNIIPKHSDTFEPGAILVNSWGWEQTNIDFYCIVKRSGQWVTVLPMTKHTSEELGFMVNDETPGTINFAASPQRKKLSFYNGKESGFSFGNYSGAGFCHLWKGKPERSTHYA